MKQSGVQRCICNINLVSFQFSSMKQLWEFWNFQTLLKKRSEVQKVILMETR